MPFNTNISGSFPACHRWGSVSPRAIVGSLAIGRAHGRGVSRYAAAVDLPKNILPGMRIAPTCPICACLARARMINLPMTNPTSSSLGLYIKSTFWTLLALFGLGIALSAAFFLIEGAVAFGGGDMLQYEAVALPFTFLLFIAAAFTFGLPYLVPLLVAATTLFAGVARVTGESRALSITIGVLTSWAAGGYIYVTDIQSTPGQSPLPAVVIFTLMGAIAGAVFWAVLSTQRDKLKQKPHN